MKTTSHSSKHRTFGDMFRRLGTTLLTAAFVFTFSLYIEPVREAHATPTPGQIAARITQLTGLTPAEIDQIYAAEQAPNLVLIAYDISIPILLEDRIGYLLIRQASTGQWIRMQVPLGEWKSDFIPYLESQGVTIHKQRYGTIDTTTPAAEAAAIAALESFPGAAIANLVLYGDFAGPSGTIPAAPAAATYSPPSLASIPGVDSVGTTAGSFRVDESGAATYSIPIAAAAGTAGVAPQIELNYSSSAGNGIAGQGWSIGGLSAISRCRQTYDQDRNMTPITFGTGDRFCLDGQRLVLTSAGNYGDANTTYRTEIDSGAIVTAIGNVNGGPDYFEVRRKDGSTSYYGKAPGSADTSAKLSNAAGNTLTWSIRRFEDSVNRTGSLNGNPIWFVYDSGAGYQRIDEIRWAYGSATGPDIGFNARLNFIYENRNDAIERYVLGSLFTDSQRLKRIESSNIVPTQANPGGAETVIRSYELRYGESITVNDQLSRLTSIEECAGTACLPKTTFSWNAPVLAADPQLVSMFDMSNSLAAFQQADINGDGQMDLVWLQGNNSTKSLKYALSNGTSFVTQTFSNGSNVKSVKVGNLNPQLRTLDYNLDGRQDIAYFDTDLSRWRILVAEPFGSSQWRLNATEVTTPIAEPHVTFVDADSNGTTDAVYPRKGPTRTYLFVRRLLPDPSKNPNSSTYYHFAAEDQISGSGTNATLGEIAVIAPDFNGDGNVDIIMGGIGEVCDESNPDDCNEIYNPGRAMRLTGVEDDNAALSVYFTFPSVSILVNGLPVTHYPTIDEIQVVDINQDGLSDLFYPLSSTRNDDAVRFELRINEGNGSFANPILITESTMLDEDADVQLVDWNMDGYADILWRDRTGSGEILVKYWEPQSGNFGANGSVTSAVSKNKSETVQFFDVNGDAAPEVIRVNKNGNIGDGEVLVRQSGGVAVNVAVNRIHRFTNGLGAKTKVDYEPLSSTAHYERLQVTTSQETATFCEDVGPNEQICYDEPIQVTNKAAFYEAINGGWDYPSTWQTLGNNSPIMELYEPMYVVTRVTGDAPAAGVNPGSVNNSATSEIEYFYAEGKNQAAGRGFLGFQRMATVDMQTQIRSTTRYRQDWPFIGRSMSTLVESFEGNTLASSTSLWEIVGWTASMVTTAQNQGTAELDYLHVVQTVNNEKSYDLLANGSGQGTLLSNVTTTVVYDAEANAEKITVVTEDVDGQLKNVVTDNKYFGGVSQPQTFDLFDARLSSTDVTTTYGGIQTSRSSAFTYYDSGVAEGLLKEEIVEPLTALEIRTEHSYDSLGNLNKSKVVAGGETRCNVVTAVFDTTGRYVDETFDCLGRKTSTVVYRNEFGSQTEVNSYTDTAGQSFVTTKTAYSVLGREYYSHGSNGASTTQFLSTDLSNCPAGTATKGVTRTAGGGESQVCSDVLGRETRALTKGFDGAWDAQDTEYDALGRVVFRSEPRDIGTVAFWTRISYDLLGRPTQSILPDQSLSSTVYEFVSSTQIPGLRRPGLKTVVTNDKSQTHTEITNAVGEVTDVIANDGGHTEFTYDGQGNLRIMKDPASNSTLMTYDDLGRKKTMTFPGNRIWSYDYNGFGEIVKQTDAKSQVQIMAYDGLGRMTCRRDERTTDAAPCGQTNANTEGHAVWVYDTAANGLGQVASVSDSISAFQKVYTFDSKGRLSNTDTTIDGSTYSEKTTYDQFGRTYQVFDAAGDGSFTDQGVVHYYNAQGYLERVGDAVEVAGSPRTVYREITAMNARGQVTVEKLGDGVVSTTNGYENTTGRLTSIDSITGSINYDVQDLDYLWDTLGNLVHRKEKSGSKDLTETFEYTDGMNRLTKYTVTGQTPVTMVYDSIGNIKKKSDVSANDYLYGAGNAGPYAVTTAGSATYLYDDNGNNYDGDGRDSVYTVFDKPSQIKKGVFTVDIEYGPDRARFKRTDSQTGSGSTVTRYLGNVEIIDRADGTHERKRHIAGIAIETMHFGTNTIEDYRETHYQFRDHLGSLDVLTNSSGEIVQEMSFDPWGQRRNAINWQALASGDLTNFDHSITTRGFTGHEMLDEVGIVHMNGRIYDAKLARFLQVDPLVQDPNNTQSLNRHSYVWNNPLNATDPSGYSKLPFDLRTLGPYGFIYSVFKFAQSHIKKPTTPTIATPNHIPGVSSNSLGNGATAIASESTRDFIELVSRFGVAAAMTIGQTSTPETGEKRRNGGSSSAFPADASNQTQAPFMSDGIPRFYDGIDLSVIDLIAGTQVSDWRNSTTLSRKECVRFGARCGFVVQGNPDADGSAPWYRWRAMSPVNDLDRHILEAATLTDVDPDLIRAIMFLETTHGYYDAPWRWFNADDSIRPMNINTAYWGDTFGSRNDLRDPFKNVLGGAQMLRSISGNFNNRASIAKIATLYNNVNALQVTDYGARVREIYRAKEWTK